MSCFLVTLASLSLVAFSASVTRRTLKERVGIEQTGKKTKVMVISRNSECPQINIFTNRNKLKRRDQFKYLGTLISSNGYNITEFA